MNAFDHENSIYGAFGEFEGAPEKYDWDAHNAEAEEYFNEYDGLEVDFAADLAQAFEEMAYWDSLSVMVVSNSYRLDDTPIFNRLAVERRDWAFVPHCPHSLSPDLCEGPQHYPFDREEEAWR